MEPVEEAIGEVASVVDAGSPVDPPDPQDSKPERENLQPGNVTDEVGYSSLVSTEGKAGVGGGNEGEAEHGYIGDMQERENSRG